MQLTVGSTVPLVDTAIGRAYYSALDEKQQALLEEYGLSRYIGDRESVKVKYLDRASSIF
ncbi:IclR family transcriptional regulator [Oligella ureolytica]